jgi:hypothetical protein
MSEKSRAAKRRAALIHGRKTNLSPAQVRIELLRKLHPDGPEILAAAIAAVAGGDFEPYELAGAQALAEAEILRRAGVDAIQEKGVIVKEIRVERGPDGQEIARTEKWKANPLLDHVRRFHPVLGFTAEEMQITRRGRGQGARDAATTRLLERAAMLREAIKATPMLSPAPDPIDVTPEPAKE